jgi:hypothetical protein
LVNIEKATLRHWLQTLLTSAVDRADVSPVGGLLLGKQLDRKLSRPEIWPGKVVAKRKIPDPVGN